MTDRVSLPRRIVIGLLRGYKRFISPLLPPACRYEPTCSVYMSEAVEMHGVMRGGWLGLRRLLRCHPFARGGFDPTPLPSNASADRSASSPPDGSSCCNKEEEGMLR